MARQLLFSSLLFHAWRITIFAGLLEQTPATTLSLSSDKRAIGGVFSAFGICRECIFTDFIHITLLSLFLAFMTTEKCTW